jgi:hypothetical protein
MDMITSHENSLRNRKKGMTTIGAVFAVIVVAAIGAVAYIQWGDTSFGSAPTVDDVMAAHQSVDSFQYDASLTIDTQLDPEALSARSDTQNLRQSLQYIPNTPADGFPESLSADLTVSGGISMASSTIEQAETDISLSAGAQELEEVFAMNFRRVGDMQYVRAQTLPNIGFFPVDQYEGNWYSASSTNQSQLGSGSISAQLPSGVPSDAEISRETTKELAQAMISEGVITVEDSIRTELRSGAPAWQFRIGVDPQQADAYRDRARQIVQDNNSDLAEDSSAFATSSDADFQKGLEQFDKRVDEFSIWVDRSSDRVRRVVVESDIDSSELEELNQNESQLDGVEQMTVSLDVGLSGYNEPVDVNAPDNAQPIQSIFQGMMQPGSGSVQPGSFQ